MTDAQVTRDAIGSDGGLVERVYASLRDEIVSGRLSAGERLVLEEVARRNGVSRTPVREALQRLRAERLVAFSVQRGFRVIDPLSDALDVYMIRERLEGLAASLAAEVISVAELQGLEERAAAMEAEGARGEDADLVLIGRLNAEFHRMVARACRRPRIIDLCEQLEKEYLARQMVIRLAPEMRRRSLHGHRALVDALWRRDSALADQLAQEHLRIGREAFPSLSAVPPTAQREQGGDGGQ